MSNAQHASTAPDLDALALDVARRFTEEWDPQRRASLQVAIIQAIRTAHAQPAELAEQQGRSTFDVTDPWRGLYLPARMPAPSEYGDLTHPDIPLWPDDREDALDKLVHAQGFDFHIVAGDFTEAAMEDGDELYWEELRAWNPEAPEGEWRLAWKGDTEDGPYAWFVRPMALRPEPAALAATGKQQVGDLGGNEGYGTRYVAPAQVGEVRGDARAQFEAWHCEKFKTRWQTGAPTRDMHNGVYAEKYGPAEEQVRWEAWQDGWQAALAARQPGAQVPVAQVRQNGGHTSPEVWFYPETFYGTKIPDGADLFLGPDTQGIDLGQVHAAVESLLEFADHHESCGDSDSFNNAEFQTCGCGFDSAREQIWDALDGQHDAAPGVGNG